MSLTDRNGIIPVLSSSGKFDFVASMQRRCADERCSCTFFDHDAIEQLHEGDQMHIPFTPHMAYGDMFVGKSLEYDISMLMTKGHGAATIAKMLRAKSRARLWSLR